MNFPPGPLLLVLPLALLVGCAKGTSSPHADARAQAMARLHARSASSDAGSARSLDYLEYRVQPELGQISVFTGAVDGTKTVRRLRDTAESLLKQGILVCTGNRPCSLRRTDKLAGHRIDTMILAAPPDEENPEAGWTRHLLVSIDGRPKVDSSLGEAREGNLIVYGMQVFPEDGTLDFTASDSDGHELVLPNELTSLDDPAVITDEDFAEPSDDAPLDERPMPMRV